MQTTEQSKTLAKNYNAVKENIKKPANRQADHKRKLLYWR